MGNGGSYTLRRKKWKGGTSLPYNVSSSIFHEYVAWQLNRQNTTSNKYKHCSTIVNNVQPIQ